MCEGDTHTHTHHISDLCTKELLFWLALLLAVWGNTLIVGFFGGTGGWVGGWGLNGDMVDDMIPNLIPMMLLLMMKMMRMTMMLVMITVLMMMIPRMPLTAMLWLMQAVAQV